MFDSTPTGWDPTLAAAAMRPGEAERESPWYRVGGPTPHPPQVAPGFAAAWRAGILPPPPGNGRLAALPGVAPSDRVWSAIICFFGAIAGCIVVDKSGLHHVAVPATRGLRTPVLVAAAVQVVPRTCGRRAPGRATPRSRGRARGG